ncbi:MAG: DNA-protecting protein DprA [Firmicutes bacterium]|nr:DNA-protecting protein DprA [Bacillota bacterium]
MNDLIPYLWLSQIRNLHPRHRRVFLAHFGSAGGVYEASRGQLLDCILQHPELSRISDEAIARLCNKNTRPAEAILKQCEQKQIDILPLGAERYPEHLRAITDAPTLLYARGDQSLLQEPGCAVVGTRRASPYGRWVASEIGKRLASYGMTVVSGMAEGIDSCGHRGCLERGGKTIAVFGCGVDVCFPLSNRPLYEEILEKGLAVSEYPPGMEATGWSFPQRNRIISGLSSKIIVVEGALKSGSLITAALGAEQGRDVYAVPGNIDQPNSIGVNKLISDGALPIFDLDDLTSALGLGRRQLRKVLPRLSGDEQLLYKVIITEPGLSSEVLAMKTGLDHRSVRTQLMAMELKALVRCDGSRYYVK